MSIPKGEGGRFDLSGKLRRYAEAVAALRRTAVLAQLPAGAGGGRAVHAGRLRSGQQGLCQLAAEHLRPVPRLQLVRPGNRGAAAGIIAPRLSKEVVTGCEFTARRVARLWDTNLMQCHEFWRFGLACLPQCCVDVQRNQIPPRARL